MEEEISLEDHVVATDDGGRAIIDRDCILLLNIQDNTPVYAVLNNKIKNYYGLCTESVTDDEIENVPADPGDKFQWQHQSVLLFLDEYKKRLNAFRNPKIKKKILWDGIAAIMKSKGYSVDADALDRKMRNMKNTYRTILLNNNRKKTTGRGRMIWEYFDIFEDLFRDDKTVNISNTMASIVENKELPNIQNKDNVTTPESSQNTNSVRKSNTKEVGPSTTKRLDRFRKRQLEIEEQKLAEVKRLREAMEEGNEIQKQKVILLKELLQQQN